MDRAIELPHFEVERWGAMRWAGGDLAPLCVLVALEQEWELAPPIPAVRNVISAIRGLESPRLFITRRNDHAISVDAGSGWPNAATHGKGPQAFLSYLEAAWVKALSGQRFEYRVMQIRGGQPALCLEQARELYGDRFQWMLERESPAHTKDDAKTWQQRALEVAASGIKDPAVIAKRINLAEELNIKPPSARRAVQRLLDRPNQPATASPWDALNRA